MVAAKRKKDLMSLSAAIETVACKDDDVVFIHTYETSDTDEYIVSDIPDKLLNKSVKLICPHYGGIDKNYNCYFFVLER